MGERLNLAVDDGIGDLLTELAGGERKRGGFLSDLIRGMAQAQATPGADVRLLFNAVMGISSQIAGMDGRVATMESEIGALKAQVVALMAKSTPYP